MSDIEKQTGTGQPQALPDDKPPSNVRKVWIFPIDMDYIKSLCGILQLAIAGLSLIALICCSAGRTPSCDYSYAASYNFFGFVAGSTFLTMLLWWMFFVVTLNQRLNVVPWRFGEVIILTIFGIMYIIGDIVIAAQPCGKDSNRAAAAFGFFAFFCMCGHFYLSFRLWRETEKPVAQGPQEPAPGDNTKY